MLFCFMLCEHRYYFAAIRAKIPYKKRTKTTKRGRHSKKGRNKAMLNQESQASHVEWGVVKNCVTFIILRTAGCNLNLPPIFNLLCNQSSSSDKSTLRLCTQTDSTSFTRPAMCLVPSSMWRLTAASFVKIRERFWGGFWLVYSWGDRGQLTVKDCLRHPYAIGSINFHFALSPLEWSIEASTSLQTLNRNMEFQSLLNKREMN